MTGQPDSVALPLQMAVGVLHGRVDAIEKRMEQQDRRFDGIDLKLDRILDTLASDRGERKMAGSIGNFAKWALGALAGGAGYLFGQWHVPH